MSFVIEKGKMKKYVPEGENDVLIPEGVTSIGANVFSGCESLRTVTFPATMKEIGQRSFAKCPNLESVTIPSNVKKIANYAFFQCTNLGSVCIEEGVEIIGDSAFSGCKSLHTLSLPENAIDIGKYAFFECDGLADENGFVIVKDKLYTYCGNSQVIVIPSHVKRIEDKALQSNEMEMLPGYGLTRKVRKVEDLVIPNAVFEETAFDGCVANYLVSLYSSIECWENPDKKQKVFETFMMKKDVYPYHERTVERNWEYIIKYRKKYLPYFFEHDLVEGIQKIAEAGRLDKKEFEEQYLLPAQQANAIQCCAYLLEWSKNN